MKKILPLIALISILSAPSLSNAQEKMKWNLKMQS